MSALDANSLLNRRAALMAATAAGACAVSAGIAVAQYRPPLDETPLVTAPQSGVGVRITLPDGQSMELRATSVVLHFPAGGAIQATETGLLPVTASQVPAAVKLDWIAPTEKLPDDAPATPAQELPR